MLLSPITITLPIKMTYMEVKQAGNVDISKADYFDDLYHFYDLTYDITNNAAMSVPTTGGNGMWKYGFIGIGMIAITTVFIFGKQKKKQKNQIR